MKKQLLSLLTLCLLVLVSCTETAPSEAIEAPDYAAFDQKVESIRAFYKSHCDEDLDAVAAALADDIKYSPPHYNENQWLGKDEFLAALKNYHANYDNIRFIEGVVMPDGTDEGYWSGSVFPQETATTDSDFIRIYGTWLATHVASGQEVGIKFYGLASFNDDGLLETYTDYFDLSSLVPKEVAE